MNKLYLYYWFFFCVSGIMLQGCSNDGIACWDSERALYFERNIYNTKQNKWERVDTAIVSILNNFGSNEIVHYFKINLLGDTLSVDTEYALVVVDSMTTAEEGMVTLPEKILFRKGVVADSLKLTVHSSKVPKGEEYKITYRLIPNQYFMVGYKDYLQVTLYFNNKEMCPVWWDDRITEVYLGKWSQKKMNTLVIATGGINSFEGLGATECRYYALQLKRYIEKNGVTEENGEPMIIPIY